MGVVLGIDIGGTFTDCIAVQPSGDVEIGKAFSTPPDFHDGFIASIESVAQHLGTTGHELLANADGVYHGCTIGTNALVEGRTARVALLTTRGFRDSLFQMKGGRRLQNASPAYVADAPTTKARPAGPARPRARGRRAHRLRWRRGRATQRGPAAPRRAGADRRRRRGDRDLAAVVDPQRRARAARRRDRPRDGARPVRVGRLAGRAPLGRVRAHGGHRNERAHRPGHGPLPRRPAGALHKPWLPRPGPDHDLFGRADLHDRGAAAAGADDRLGARRRPDRLAQGGDDR